MTTIKTKSILLLILLCSLQLLNAQKYSKRSSGNISQEEIDMEHCSFDTSANAVVLFDFGSSLFKFENGYFNIQFTRHKRMKIFNEQGIRHGAVGIPIYDDGNNSEKILNINAFTYIEKNGTLEKHELDPTTVYTERISQNWKQQKFVFPNLKENAILEYYYTLETPFLFNLPDWEFQSQIPTIYSHYQVSMVPFYSYVFLMQRIDSLSFYNSEEGWKEHSIGPYTYRELTHSFAMKNIEAFKDEAYITSINDFIKKIDFQLSNVINVNGSNTEIISTWPKLKKELLTNDFFGDYIKDSKRYAKSILEKIDTVGKSQQQITEDLVKYVKESFYWNNYYGKHASQKPKEFITRKSGNVADINLFLLALLREAGIKSEPVILSTRNHGKIYPQYPITKKFNYVLVDVNIEGNTFITDATNPIMDYSMIPPQCLNDSGFVIAKNKEIEWVTLHFNEPSSKKVNIDISVNPQSKTCAISGSIQTTKYEALQYRSDDKNDTSDIKKVLENQFDEVYSIQTKNHNSPARLYNRFQS